MLSTTAGNEEDEEEQWDSSGGGMWDVIEGGSGIEENMERPGSISGKSCFAT